MSYFITNSLNNWMPSLYNTIYGLGLRESLRAASLTNVAQVLLLLLCAFFIDRVGRRNWTVACFLAGGLLLAVLGLAGARSVTSVMTLATLSYGIVGSVNAVLYLYTPEIYPTRMRAIGTGLATSWLRLASAVGPAIVGVMVGSVGIGSVFIMFAAVGGCWRGRGHVHDRDARPAIGRDSVVKSLSHGRGWREAPGEGRSGAQFRPSPNPLPEGEGFIKIAFALNAERPRIPTVRTTNASEIGRVKKIEYSPPLISSDRWKLASIRFPRTSPNTRQVAG